MLNSLDQHISALTLALADVTQSRENDALDKIKTCSKITPQLALDIYRNNTHGARVHALEDIFPVCVKILGEEVFRLISRDYVNKDKKGMADLNQYGHKFHQHITTLLKMQRLPEDYAYLADLAKLEYLLHSAYYADDDPAFDFKGFEKHLTCRKPTFLKPSHSLGLLQTNYPIRQIWLCNKNQLGFETVEAINESQFLLVYRKRFKPKIFLINENEFHLIEALINAKSLQEITEEEKYDTNIILPRLIENRWVNGYY